jgi:hypothetical protein
VLRDRQIRAAQALDRKLWEELALTGSRAPRVRTDLVLHSKHPAEKRAAIVALLALRWHFDRLARERRVAMAEVEQAPVGSEDVRRAAFWEMRDINLPTPGRAAAHRLAESPNPVDQELLAALFLQGPDSDVLYAGRLSLQAGRLVFLGELLKHLQEGRDQTAEWVARLLAQEQQEAALPVLVEKLKDPGARVRSAAAFALCWYPSPKAVPGLLDALKAEKDAGVRTQLLTALAQTGDARGLDALLTAAAGDVKGQLGIELARGLSRIGDKKALPVLATMLGRSQDAQYQWEVVNAFGHISQLFPAYPAARFWSGGAIHPERLRRGLDEIARWQKARPK